MLKTAIPILAYLNDKETIAFYTQKLGFTSHGNWEGYLMFTKDEIELHLWICDDENIPKNTGCYIRLDEIETFYAECLKQNIVHPNGKLELKPWNIYQFSILDNSGNIINFGQFADTKK